MTTPHAMSMPRPGWAEVDAEAVWWADTVQLSRKLVVEAGDHPIAGVAVSGVGPCLLLCDGDGAPVRPAILYGIDMRATAEIAELTDRYGADESSYTAASSCRRRPLAQKCCGSSATRATSGRGVPGGSTPARSSPTASPTSSTPPQYATMKASATSDLTVGGSHLAAHALKAGLVDECHLFIRPVLVGGGKPALPSDTRADLELLDDRRLSNGVVYLRYRIPT